MKKIERAFFGLILLALILVVLSCAINPVSGKRELMLFSEKQEIAMGQETDQQIRQQFGIYESKGLQDYINGVGQKMVPYSHRPNLKYHFAVLDTAVVNAFAAPGGYIYVTRGILALMGSEAELAVVLGHEMGHVAARHSMKQLSGQLLAQVGLAVGSILSKDIRKLAWLAGIGMQLLFLKFSRSDEYQADSLGIGYARQARYAPGEMLRFFTALENMSADSGGHGLPTFLSTHPMTSDRIAKVRELVSSQDARLAVKSEPYLSKLDGMVYGDNPKQGFLENGVFYHPEMAFQFAIPIGLYVHRHERPQRGRCFPAAARPRHSFISAAERSRLSESPTQPPEPGPRRRQSDLAGDFQFGRRGPKNVETARGVQRHRPGEHSRSTAVDQAR
ncbi:MAG: M48 family metallopeptidase [Candidatus Aminicenantes bacterium]|nr:M48 family metallopeptidase [Candidatus Aminicenantes bacterium]